LNYEYPTWSILPLTAMCAPWESTGQPILETDMDI
jgi:hypothetical protein